MRRRTEIWCCLKDFLILFAPVKIRQQILKLCCYVTCKCLLNTFTLTSECPNCCSNLTSGIKLRENVPALSISRRVRMVLHYRYIRTINTSWPQNRFVIMVKTNTGAQGQVFLFGSRSQGHVAWCSFCCQKGYFRFLLNYIKNYL